MPTFLTVHTFCVYLEILGLPVGGALYRNTENLASALGIQKKNGGNHAFFRDNKGLI